MPSATRMTVVTPDAFSFAMICEACAWIVAGSSSYGSDSVIAAPPSVRSASNAAAITGDSGLEEIQTWPNTRGVACERLVAGELGVAAAELLGDELGRVGSGLGGADRRGRDVRVALGVPLGRLPGRAADAHHPTCAEFVGERARQCGAAEHDEWLEVLGDTHGVGASGDLVVREPGALVELEFDRSRP